MMVWDVMPHAGASQIHPHVAGFLGKGKYLGKMGKLNHASTSYRKMNLQRDYWKDYLNLHIALGLGVRYHTASIIVPIDSQKEHEFVIVGTTSLRDWIRAFYLIYRTYVEELKVYCFSSGMAWPTSILTEHIQTLSNMKRNNRKTPRKNRSASSFDDGNLMFARIGGRGNCESIESDVSALELYAINHLSSDPFTTIRALKKTILKHDPVL